MPADHAHFIIACFKEGSRRPDFQHKWMTPDTWAAILNKYCVNDSSLAFTGKQLLGAINSRKQAHFQQELDLRGNITADHCGIFHDKHTSMEALLLLGAIMQPLKGTALLKQRKSGTKKYIMQQLY
jgi:hypothetical protein